jgi:hypothetical protein
VQQYTGTPLLGSTAASYFTATLLLLPTTFLLLYCSSIEGRRCLAVHAAVYTCVLACNVYMRIGIHVLLRRFMHTRLLGAWQRPY